jgi:pimeloyl-ACP methyl ester carboxylesterase
VSAEARHAARASRRRAVPDGALPLPEDHEILQASDGARIAVTREGHGPPVVLLHGWATDRSVWNEVAVGLVDAGHQVVRYDMRGHGRSTVGSGDLSMARLVADLDTVLKATSVDDAVIVGHSLGSLTALVYLSGAGNPVAADRAQARVRAAVLAAAGVPDPKVGPLMLAVSRWAMRSAMVERLFRCERLGLALLDPSGDRAPAHVRAERASFLATPPEVRSGLLATIQHNFVPGLGPYRTPTTLIVGSRDRYATPARARQLAELLPDAAVMELPGFGHNLPYEAPRVLVDSVTAAAS